MSGHFLQFRKIEVRANDKDYFLGPARAEMLYFSGKYLDLICRQEPDRMQSFSPSKRPEIAIRRQKPRKLFNAVRRCGLWFSPETRRKPPKIKLLILNSSTQR
jgi:hypothetical protein